MKTIRRQSPRGNRRLRTCLAILVVAGCLPARVVDSQPHWPQFRGPGGQGVAEHATPPLHFSLVSNLVWRAAVAPGHSSPCLWGDQVFLTAVESQQLTVVCFARTTGQLRWRSVTPTQKIAHDRDPGIAAAPTPAADADRVYAYFGSFGLIGLTHDGQAAWRRPLPAPRNKYGAATSPVLYRSNLFLVVDSEDGTARLIAFQCTNGAIAWQRRRDTANRAGWSTPTIWPGQGGDELVVLGAHRLTAYDPQTGQERWWIGGFPQETIGLPVHAEGLLFASSAALGGRGEQRYDSGPWKQFLRLDTDGDGKVQREEIPDQLGVIYRPELSPDNPGYSPGAPLKRTFDSDDRDRDGALNQAEFEARLRRIESISSPVLMAIRPGGRQDATATHVAWQGRRGIPEVPSLLCYRGRLYLLRDGGLVTCLRTSDGTLLYEERVGALGQYCASPIAAAGRVYLASRSGVVTVLDGTRDEFRILAQARLGEEIFATPALAGDTIYVRSTRALYAFRASAAGGTSVPD